MMDTDVDDFEIVEEEDEKEKKSKKIDIKTRLDELEEKFENTLYFQMLKQT